MEAELHGLSCTAVHNPEYAAGMNTSLRAGVRALAEDVQGAVVLLGDMPLVDATMVRTLVDSFRREQPPLVIELLEELCDAIHERTPTKGAVKACVRARRQTGARAHLVGNDSARPLESAAPGRCR
ncbi:MAG: hypothetical protein E6J82_05475 [Deltaproteobacteria bacterium]|nr:MAG: hypothetical protein E6J82_05475 [Deltaproteobacteria bacterium]